MRGNPIGTVSAPSAGTRSTTVDPDDFTIATMPARFAELGDLHAGIDDAVFDIAPLLEWAERDEDGRAPAPPADPEDDGAVTVARAGIENVFYFTSARRCVKYSAESRLPP